MATETVINRPAPFVEDIGKKLGRTNIRTSTSYLL